MKNYVISYTPFSNKLFEKYDQIQANSPIEAAKKYINGRYLHIKRSGDTDVNLCVMEGTYNEEENIINVKGRRQWYKCYN